MTDRGLEKEGDRDFIELGGWRLICDTPFKAWPLHYRSGTYFGTDMFSCIIEIYTHMNLCKLTAKPDGILAVEDSPIPFPKAFSMRKYQMQRSIT